MKLLLLTLAILFASGCASTTSEAVEATPEGVVLLSEESLETSVKSGRVLGNLRDSWSAHVKDCRTGLEFTRRTFARNTERGWDRLVWLFQ
jgi:hypothetical protein